MLYNDCRICDKWPKVIGSKAWIALEVIKEGFGIGIVVWIYMNRSMSDRVSLREVLSLYVQVGCLTHSNFFHSFGCRRFRLCSSSARTFRATAFAIRWRTKSATPSCTVTRPATLRKRRTASRQSV